MNDYGLNKEIVKIIYPTWLFIDRYTPKSDVAFVCIPEMSDGGVKFDFNNWNDLMPLVVEHQIMYIVVDYGFVAFKHLLEIDGDNCEATNKNPQRALAECLLKVLTKF